MFKLLYRLFLQRYRQFGAEWQDKSVNNPNSKRTALKSRTWAAGIIFGCVVIASFIVVKNYELNFGNRALDRSASLAIEVSSIIAVPLVVYMERWPLEQQPIEPSGELVQLVIENNLFKPIFQVVRPGGTFAVVNQDRILHNAHIISEGDTVFNVATPLQSGSVQKPLSATGMLFVKCDLHPGMHAWIFVPPNRFHSVREATGNIEWTGIEPGQYRVRIWQAGRITDEQILNFASGESKSIRHS